MNTEFELLLKSLPETISSLVDQGLNLIDIAIDIGRPLEMRYMNEMDRHEYIVTEEDIDYITSRIGAKTFDISNRAGTPNTLHRYSRIQDKFNNTIGYTIRVGRYIAGAHMIIEDLLNDGKSVIFLGAPSLGKAQPLTSQLMTPNGFTSMGEIKVGDEVITKNGKATKVTGVFPQGVKDIYRVTLSDGTSTECCDEHLWELTSRDHHRTQTTAVKPLKDIIKDYKTQEGVTERRKYSVPQNPVVYFEEQALEIQPYLMGAMLGDGSFSAGVKFSCTEQEILDRLSLDLPLNYTAKDYGGNTYGFTRGNTGRGRSCQMIEEYKELNLIGTRSNNKFIPSKYLFNSENNRIKLLQGLMDTDGTAGKGNNLEYSTVSKQLADDVVFLVRSLGAKAKISLKNPFYTYKGERKEGQLCYRISFNLPNHIKPFCLKRKLDRLSNSQSRFITRFISDISYIGKAEAQCISVEDDSHLYMTDNFILTHNTTILRSASNYLAEERRVVIVDTSNEIAGEGSLPHSSIGYARRLQIPKDRTQEEVMIEAVENHSPEVIVIDEISTNEESRAAKTITKRGVQLIATAHGSNMTDFVENEPLATLLGGISRSILSDERASQETNGKKQILERVGKSSFQAVVEIRSYTEVGIYTDLEDVVDAILKGNRVEPEIRRILPDGEIKVLQTQKITEKKAASVEIASNDPEDRSFRTGVRSETKPKRSFSKRVR